ncbi:SGNH/GDSL hydrolase family protein, partial [bacterium]|nr:SGNH/GDSL hydrolase family protein [bacterium]
PNTWRITRPLSRYKKEHGKEEIWIFGGSFTHGWCLNDEATYPWRLQKRFPQYKIVNYGVEGYGTVHSLLQMRQALARKTPKAVVLAYAHFHDERNTFLRHRRKQIAPWCKLGRLVQPYARLNNEGKLVIKMAEVEYREFPLMRYLSLAHYVEQIYNHVEDRFHNSQAVTQALIGSMADIAKKHKIPFILAGIDHGEAMMDYAKTHGIPHVDISVNLRRPYYNNSPHDLHPSAAANQVYAQKLGDFLEKEILP